MRTNPYIDDILSQPGVLKNMLQTLDLAPLENVKKMLAGGEFDRVIITGMGASFYGVCPAWLLLSQAGLPAYWVDSAELVYYAGGLITPRTLLWVVSQSGRSAEIMHFISPDAVNKPKMILALTNDLSSPLAQKSAVTLPINAPVELTVSTRTYLNTLAISQLMALKLSGQDTSQGFNDLMDVSLNIEAYFKDWKTRVTTLIQTVGLPRNMVILGRGPSLASAQTGALVQGEASKYPVIALNAAEFRHGPMEMIRPDLTVMVLAGQEDTMALNSQLAVEIARLGGKVFWVGSRPATALPWIEMPAGKGLGLPVAEIVPFQLLSLALAQQIGVEAGKFFHSGKVTLIE